MELELQKHYMRNPSLLSRVFEDEVVLLPICKDTVKPERILIISGAGVRIWQLIDGQRSIKEVEREVVKQFKVDSQKAGEDLIMFLKELKKRRCIKEVKNEKEKKIKIKK